MNYSSNKLTVNIIFKAIYVTCELNDECIGKTVVRSLKKYNHSSKMLKIHRHHKKFELSSSSLTHAHVSFRLRGRQRDWSSCVSEACFWGRLSGGRWHQRRVGQWDRRQPAEWPPRAGSHGGRGWRVIKGEREEAGHKHPGERGVSSVK